jgi:hypothetical protein
MLIDASHTLPLTHPYIPHPTLSHTQLGVGLVIVFGFLVLQLRLQPCATKDLNNMQAISQISLMLTLFVGLMLVIERYIQHELDLLASGPWGVMDKAQMRIRELNKFIFTYIGIGVNVFTMCAPPLLIVSRIYLGLGTREEMLAKAKTQMKDMKEKMNDMKELTGLASKANAPVPNDDASSKADAPVPNGDANKAQTRFAGTANALVLAGVGTAVGVCSVTASQKRKAELEVTEEEGKDLEIELELTMSIREIVGKEEEFKTDLVHDVAQAIGDVANVKVLGIHAIPNGEAGIVVQLRLTPGMSSDVHNNDDTATRSSQWLVNVMAATELAQQATDANSPLKQGRVTNKSKTLRVTAVSSKASHSMVNGQLEMQMVGDKDHSDTVHGSQAESAVAIASSASLVDDVDKHICVIPESSVEVLKKFKSRSIVDDPGSLENGTELGVTTPSSLAPRGPSSWGRFTPLVAKDGQDCLRTPAQLPHPESPRSSSSVLLKKHMNGSMNSLSGINDDEFRGQMLHGTDLPKDIAKEVLSGPPLPHQNSDPWGQYSTVTATLCSAPHTPHVEHRPKSWGSNIAGPSRDSL